jgi:hypothetical protein
LIPENYPCDPVVFRSLKVGDWILPAVSTFVVAWLVSFLHWSLFNTMPDAVSAMQSFHALGQDGWRGLNSLEDVPVFGVHLWFGGLVALPIFHWLPSYLTLVAVQACALAFAVPAAGWLAILHGKSPSQSRRWMWLWAVHPMLIGAHCGWGEGWQPLLLAVPALMWALVFAFERRWMPFFVASVVAMACREDVAIVVAGLGVWLIVVRNEKGRGVLLVAMALVWYAMAVRVVLPLSTGGSWNVLEKAFPSVARQSSAGGGWMAIWASALAKNILQPATFAAIGFLYLVWGRIGRKAAIHLIPVSLWVLAMSAVEMWATRNPYLHYLAPTIPFLFLSALNEPDVKKRLLVGLALAFAGFAVWQGRLVWNGVEGADFDAMTCIERNIPATARTAILSPRGATRYARGQELKWLDTATAKFEVLIVDETRKFPGRWSPSEVAGFERMASESGAHLILNRPGIRLWSRTDSVQLDCR